MIFWATVIYCLIKSIRITKRKRPTTEIITPPPKQKETGWEKRKTNSGSEYEQKGGFDDEGTMIYEIKMNLPNVTETQPNDNNRNEIVF